MATEDLGRVSRDRGDRQEYIEIEEIEDKNT